MKQTQKDDFDLEEDNTQNINMPLETPKGPITEEEFETIRARQRFLTY